MAQAPAAQTGEALAKEHTLPQAPQWATSVAGVVSQPLEGLPSQLAWPGAHDPRAHAPAAQTALA